MDFSVFMFFGRGRKERAKFEVVLKYALLDLDWLGR
jgi:hypothetical protein